MNEITKGEIGDDIEQSQGIRKGFSQGPGQSKQGLKRNIAFKLRIGEILKANQIFDGEKLKFIQINEKKVSRVNLIANVVDKYFQDGEKKYSNLTLDDASGQIRVKFFGDDAKNVNDFNQGDTVLVIGLVRSWNNELYLTSEILKKKDSSYLLIRKLESEREQPVLGKEKVAELKDKIVEMIRNSEKDGGLDIDKIILELKEPPASINSEIKKILEDGIAYEPRPGKLRYLG